jgi:hypothetical protein
MKPTSHHFVFTSALCIRRSGRTILLAAALAGTLTHSAFAQLPTVTSGPAGVWRGTSLCLVHPSSCRDESVVYRVSRLNATDSLSIVARKIVNGREEEMGILGCRFDTPAGRVTCTMPQGVWRFTVRGDSLVGELRLPDSTKFRDVRASRSR